MFILSSQDGSKVKVLQTEKLRTLAQYCNVSSVPIIPTVVTNIKRNDCRLLHSGISISKNERRRKLFRFNLVTTVCLVHVSPGRKKNI